MKQIPASELDDFKKIYFADFFCFFCSTDLKKYFHPYSKEDYTIPSENKIGFYLWQQYYILSRCIDVGNTQEFTNLLFDRFSGNDKFIDFLYNYKKFFKGWEGLKGMDMMNFYEDYWGKSMAIYTASAFRFNHEEVLHHFCFWLKKEGVMNRITICGETEKQKEICRSYVNHYFNRLPINTLPKPMALNIGDWVASIGNFFKGS